MSAPLHLRGPDGSVSAPIQIAGGTREHPRVAVLPHATEDSQNRPIAKGYPANPRTLGDQIRKRRLDLRLRLNEAASRLKVRSYTILIRESGETTPALKHIPANRRFLGAWTSGPDGGPLGRGVKGLCTALGLFHDRLARQLGLDPGTVRKLEGGELLRNRRADKAIAKWMHGHNSDAAVQGESSRPPTPKSIAGSTRDLPASKRSRTPGGHGPDSEQSSRAAHRKT